MACRGNQRATLIKRNYGPADSYRHSPRPPDSLAKKRVAERSISPPRPRKTSRGEGEGATPSCYSRKRRRPPGASFSDATPCGRFRWRAGAFLGGVALGGVPGEGAMWSGGFYDVTTLPNFAHCARAAHFAAGPIPIQAVLMRRKCYGWRVWTRYPRHVFSEPPSISRPFDELLATLISTPQSPNSVPVGRVPRKGPPAPPGYSCKVPGRFVQILGRHRPEPYEHVDRVFPAVLLRRSLPVQTTRNPGGSQRGAKRVGTSGELRS